MEHAISSAERDLVIFGALRSGSTLLRLMIEAHPSLHCNGEHDYLFEYVRFDQAQVKWVIDRSNLLLDRVFISQELICPETSDAQAAVGDMIAQLRNKSDGKLVLMIHRNLTAATALLHNPLIVHLIRDPRDVAASSIGMGWSGNVYYGADHWINTEREWAIISPTFPSTSVFTLRFENLISDPLSYLNALCEFLEVDFSIQMLEYYKTTTYEPIDRSLASQWTSRRTNKEIALIELRVGELLEASGFERSDVDNIKLNILQKAALWIENKVYVWRVRVDRFGLFDSILVAAARRFGLEALAKPAILRINDRARHYLK